VIRTTLILSMLFGGVLMPTFVARNIQPTILQPNLVAQWSFVEGFNQWSLNKAGASGYPVNIFGAYSEQLTQTLDSPTQQWSQPGTTLTDFYGGTTDPNGNNSATRVQMISGSGSALYLTLTLANVAYTLSVYVKSNTGSSQAIRMGNAASPGTDKTVTTSWTRVSQTFTPSAGSNIVGILNDTALDVLDISVYGFQLELGSSPTAYPLPIADLMLGSQSYVDANDPTWNATGLTHGASVYTHGISTAPLTFSNITVYSVFKKSPGTDSPGFFEPILTSEAPGYKIVMESRDSLNAGTAANSVGPGFGFGFGGGAPPVKVANASGVKVDDGAWHVFAATYDGANIKLYFDGTQVAQQPLVVGSQTVHRFYTGIFEQIASATNYFPGTLGNIAIYSAAHSTAQIQQNTTTLQGVMAYRGICMPAPTQFIGIEGDSIAAGLGLTQAQRWSWLMLQSITPVVQQWNDAVGGSTVANATARTAVFNQAINLSTPRRLLVVELGANDITGAAGTGLAFVAALKTYCIAQRAAGWNKIVVVPVLPRGDISGFNTERNIANVAIAADPSFYDALAVINPTMMADSAPSNATLYQPDLVHPTALGNSTYLWPGIQVSVIPLLP